MPLTLIKPRTETRYLSLTVVDSLYLLYLAMIALLSVLSDLSWRVLEIHVGIACFILLLAALETRSKPARFIHDWYPLLMFIFCFEEVARYSLSIVPHWQDSWLISLENALFGGAPNLWLSGFASRFWSEVMDIGYFSYYAMFMVVGGKLYTRPNKRAFHELTISTVFTYFLAYLIYLAFPTEGPQHTMAALNNAPHGAIFNSMVRLIQHHAGVHGSWLLGESPSSRRLMSFSFSFSSFAFSPYCQSSFPSLLRISSVCFVASVNGFAVGPCLGVSCLICGNQRNQRHQR